MTEQQKARFERLKAEIIAGFVENIEVNKAIYARCAGTNQRVFAAWANEAIYFDRERLKFWMKLKPKDK